MHRSCLQFLASFQLFVYNCSTAKNNLASALHYSYFCTKQSLANVCNKITKSEDSHSSCYCYITDLSGNWHGKQLNYNGCRGYSISYWSTSIVLWYWHSMASWDSFECELHVYVVTLSKFYCLNFQHLL